MQGQCYATTEEMVMIGNFLVWLFDSEFILWPRAGIDHLVDFMCELHAFVCELDFEN